MFERLHPPPRLRNRLAVQDAARDVLGAERAARRSANPRNVAVTRTLHRCHQFRRRGGRREGIVQARSVLPPADPSPALAATASAAGDVPLLVKHFVRAAARALNTNPNLQCTRRSSRC
jgi:hypothetical protein